MPGTSLLLREVSVVLLSQYATLPAYTSGLYLSIEQIFVDASYVLDPVLGAWDTVSKTKASPCSHRAWKDLTSNRKCAGCKGPGVENMMSGGSATHFGK